MSKIEHLVMPKDHMDGLYNSKNPLVRFVHRQRLDAITAHVLPREEGIKVLDAGCGEGHLIQTLHERCSSNQYYGVDITPTALEDARERCPFGKFQIMDLSELSFESGFFDVVVATEVIEHIIEYEKVIMELTRVLKKGGALILTFPNEILWTISRLVLGRRPVRVLDHVNSFTPQMMKGLVGLDVVIQRNLPFRLPFSMSLGCLMKFRK